MAISDDRIDRIVFDIVVSRIGSWSAAKPGSMPEAYSDAAPSAAAASSWARQVGSYVAGRGAPTSWSSRR